MFFVKSMLRRVGFNSEIFAEHVDESLRNQIKQLKELRISAADILLIHHSMGHDVFDMLAELRCRKFLINHNITPPKFFKESDPFYSYAIKGYAQLSLFRDIVEGAIAPSSFNAHQLEKRGFRNVTVIPLLKDFGGLRYLPHAKACYYDEAAIFRLLFVGRIVPHKCQNELIEFVDKVRSIGNIPLGLVLVGGFGDEN